MGLNLRSEAPLILPLPHRRTYRDTTGAAGRGGTDRGWAHLAAGETSARPGGVVPVAEHSGPRAAVSPAGEGEVAASLAGCIPELGKRMNLGGFLRGQTYCVVLSSCFWLFSVLGGLLWH